VRIQCTDGDRVVQDINYELQTGQEMVLIGRSYDCDIRVDFSPSISRVQATLIFKDGDFYLIDGRPGFPSTTGVYIDGVRVRAGDNGLLSESSEIELFRSGPRIIRLMLGDDTEPIDLETLGAERQGGGLSRLTERSFGQTMTSRVAPAPEVTPQRRNSRSGSVRTIRDEVQDLRTMVEQVAEQIKEHEASCKRTNEVALQEIRALVTDHIGQTKAQADRMVESELRFEERLDQVHRTDEEQSGLIRRIAFGLAGTLMLTAAIAAGRSPDQATTDRLLDFILALTGLGGAGGGVALVASSRRSSQAENRLRDANREIADDRTHHRGNPSKPPR